MEEEELVYPHLFVYLLAIHWREEYDDDDDEKEEEEAAVEMGVFAVVVLFA